MMPDLPGDLREIILFNLLDVKRKIEQIEELLCLSEEEENNVSSEETYASEGQASICRDEEVWP
jgi:hypothetical protein